MEREEMMITEFDTGVLGEHTQCMRAVSESWKKQWCWFSFTYSRKNTILLTSYFQPRSDFQPPEMYDKILHYGNFLFLFFSNFGHTSRHVGSYFPEQGSKPWPLHRKFRVLTTGQPEGSSIVQMSLFAKQKYRHKHREQTYRHRGGKTLLFHLNQGGTVGQTGIDIYTLLPRKQITNENLLYATGGKGRYNLFVGHILS